MDGEEEVKAALRVRVWDSQQAGSKEEWCLVGEVQGVLMILLFGGC